MRASLLGPVLAFFVAAPAVAQQQRVVVLEIDGDQNNKLRDQIEAALVKAKVVEVIPLDDFREAASKKKLNGAAAMTVIGIKRVGKQLKLDAAVTGEVGEKFKVVIFDRVGVELWTKELGVKKGLLSDDFSQKLARAVAAAAEQGAARNPNEGASTEPGPSASAGGDGDSGGEIDLTGAAPSEPPPASTRRPGGGRTVIAPSQRSSGEPVAGEEGQRDTDLDLERYKQEKRKPAPRTFTVSVSGATTWRTQCLRPGSTELTSCADFDRLPMAQQPVGTTVTFTPQVPYLGVAGTVDLFPLSGLDSPFINGLGLTGAFVYGSSVTTIAEVNQAGMTEEKKVNSADLGWSAQAVYRVHFAMGAGLPQGIGYAGLRGGLTSRNFNIDPNAGVPLPSSQRLFPTGLGFAVVGGDVALHIVRFFRLEAGFSWFFNPRPADEQILGFGNLMDPTGGATSTGFGVDVGATGDLVALGKGMLGWALKARYLSFADRYWGQGQKWTVCNAQQCGGLGEETYLTITWGLTLGF